MDPAKTSSSMDLQRLADECREHDALYRLDKSRFDPQYCFELLRRALLDRSQQAWEFVVGQYREQVRRWVMRAGKFAGDPHETDAFVNETFFRFWRAPAVRTIAESPPEALGRLLQYLKKCAVTTVLDAARKANLEPLTQPIDRLPPALTAVDPRRVENVYAQKETASDLYTVILETLKSEEERVILLHKITLQKKAAAIQRNFPHLFPDTHRVYRVTENLLKRLRRDPRLLAFIESEPPGGKTASQTSSLINQSTGSDHD